MFAKMYVMYLKKIEGFHMFQTVWNLGVLAYLIYAYLELNFLYKEI